MSILILSLAADLRGQGAQDHCPRPHVDTSSWRIVQVYALGLELALPPNYRRKDWENRSDSTDYSVEYRRDGSVVNAVTISTLSPLVAGHFHSESATRRVCLLEAQLGTIAVILEETRRPTGGNTWAPLFSIRTQLVPAASRPVRVFLAAAADSATRAEQLAILQSVRFIGRGK